MASTNQIDILLKVSSDTAAIRKVQSEMQGFAKGMSSLGSKFKEGLGLAAGSLAFGGLASGVAKVGQFLVSSAADGFRFNAMLEEQRLAFTHLTGSAEEAGKRVSQLQRLSVETPFDLATWSRASTILQNFGGNALAGHDGLRLVGNIATVTGRPLEQLAQTIGRLHAKLNEGASVSEETKQLQDMGALSIEAKQRLDSLAAAKVIGPAAWQEATAALGRFSGAMDQSQHGWNGLTRQIAASWEATKGKLAEPIFEPATEAVRELAKLLGLLPTKAETVIAAIKDAADSLTSTNVTTPQLDDLRRERLSQRAAARLQLANADYGLAQEAQKPSRRNFFGGVVRDLQTQKDKAQKIIEDLNLKLVESDGITRQSFGKTRDEVLARIQQIKDGATTTEAIIVKGKHVSSYVGSRTVPRPLNEEEQAETDYLNKALEIDATAPGALKARAAQNAADAEAAATRAANARAVAEALKTARDNAADLTAKLADNELAAAALAEDFAKQTELLRARVTAAEEAYQKDIATAALATTQAEQAELRAAADQRRDAALFPLKAALADIEKKRAEAQRESTASQLAAGQQLKKNILDQIDRERELIALRTDLSPTQKQEAFNDLLKRQKAVLEEVVRLKKEELALATDPAAIARLQGEIAATQSRIDSPPPAETPALPKIEQQRKDVGDIGNGVNSYASVGDGFEGAMLSQLQQIGSEGDIVARGLQSSFDSVRTSLGSAFTDMIWQGESLKNAMSGFATSIAQSFISATAQMVADWIMQHTIMAAWKALTETQMTTAAATGAAVRTGIVAGEETAATAAKATGTAARTGFSLMEAGKNIVAAATGAMSAMASIPYVGPILAVAAVAGILALGAKLLGAFATGGLINGAGTGTSDDNLIRVSNGEYVIRNAAVEKYGVGFMDAVNAGTLDLSAGLEAIPMPLARSAGGTDASSATSPFADEGDRTITLIVITAASREEGEVLRRNAAGRAFIIDTTRDAKTEIGIRS